MGKNDGNKSMKKEKERRKNTAFEIHATLKLFLWIIIVFRYFESVMRKDEADDQYSLGYILYGVILKMLKFELLLCPRFPYGLAR